MSLDIIEAVDKVVMTEVVNRREKGKRALTAALFSPSQDVLLTSENVQVDELTGTNGMAPFVEKDGKAVVIDRLNGRSYQFETPSINIKLPLTCNDLLLKRQAGENIVISNGVDVYKNAAERQIREDLVTLDDTIENRIEWMVSQLIVGSVSYQVEGKASFTISTNKPAGNTFTVADLWDGSAPEPLRDIKKAKRIVAAVSSPGFQIGICGENASNAISAMAENDKISAIKTDSGVIAGNLTLIEDFQANGMLFLGTLGGIPMFEYTGTYLADNGGASTPYIRSDYVELLTTARPETRPMNYGAIRDIEAILAGMHITKRFATSDTDKDAGTYVAWLKSRPFPWFKRSDWNVSMKVT